MSENLCVVCKKKPIVNKKRRLCQTCYSRWYRTRDLDSKPSKVTASREVQFIKNFFKSNDSWVYQPAVFRMNGEKYSPDFYDTERNMFIEVAGSRQAFHQNKDKYKNFKKYFPKINFEVRRHDGELIDVDNLYRVKWQ